MVLFSTLAGFAFAKLRFRGRNALLLVIVATMAIPVQLGLIPLYILMVKLGWVGELQAVIVPFLVTGFGVFMMRQYAAQAVSDELIEAARVDGCNTLRIYWNVVLPAVRPAAAVLGLFTFMQTWNDFLWPYSVLNPDQPDRAGVAGHAVQRLLLRLLPDLRRHRAGHAAAARSCSSSSDGRSSAASWKVRSRHDGGPAGRAGRGERGGDARRLPLGRGHGGVPDRGRRDRGRPRTVHLGHLQPDAGDGARRRHRRRRRATTTTATARTSR